MVRDLRIFVELSHAMTPCHSSLTDFHNRDAWKNMTNSISDGEIVRLSNAIQ